LGSKLNAVHFREISDGGILAPSRKVAKADKAKRLGALATHPLLRLKSAGLVAKDFKPPIV
jgi:hypothetical protein